MTEEVLVADTAWQEQALPRLKVTGGSHENTPPQPHVILEGLFPVPSRKDPARNLKTVGGSDRRWPALTKRGLVIFGWEKRGE